MILSKHSWKVGTILYSRNSPGNVYKPESILKDYLSLNITSLIHRKQFKISFLALALNNFLQLIAGVTVVKAKDSNSEDLSILKSKD